MIINKVREERIKKGMSQLELSFATKISPSNISNIESGKLYLYSGWQKRISQALEIPEECLIINVKGDK